MNLKEMRALSRLGALAFSGSATSTTIVVRYYLDAKAGYKRTLAGSSDGTTRTSIRAR